MSFVNGDNLASSFPIFYVLLVFGEFNTMYFDHILFPPSTPPCSSPTSLLIQYNFFSLVLSLKEQQYKPPKTKTKLCKSTQKPMRTVCVSQILMSVQPALEWSWCAQLHSIQENWFFSPADVSFKEFLISFSILGFSFSGLHLHAFCSCCHSLCEFISVTDLLYLETAVFTTTDFSSM